jgi:formyl-CoA transferase
VVGPAAKLSRTPTRVRSAAPALGAHTDEVLAELGVEAAQRAALRERGVL